MRYYGLWHPSKRKQFDRVRFALELKYGALQLHEQRTIDKGVNTDEIIDPQTGEIITGNTPPCPFCGANNTRHVMHLKPARRHGASQTNARASPRIQAA